MGQNENGVCLCKKSSLRRLSPTMHRQSSALPNNQRSSAVSRQITGSRVLYAIRGQNDTRPGQQVNLARGPGDSPCRGLLNLGVDLGSW